MALVFLAALCAVASIITLPSESADSYRQESQGECTSPVCQETAQALLASMDFTVNPCQDFYRYACGGWIDSHPIPPEKGTYTAFDALIDEVADNVAGILTNATRESHTRPVRQSALFYQSCMDEEATKRTRLDSTEKSPDF
uniref:U4-Hexatoxin-Hf1g_1 n=1 Tax=Hadronyche formidabilis TaxID=426499 RepID=A0A4Q8K7S0_HADFO